MNSRGTLQLAVLLVLVAILLVSILLLSCWSNDLTSQLTTALVALLGSVVAAIVHHIAVNSPQPPVKGA